MIRAIFLDNGGVLSDNERWASEWRRLVGEYLSAHFGGDPIRWGEANREGFARWLEGYTARGPHARGQALIALLHELDRAWLQDMFRVVGQPVPDDSTAFEIARALLAWGAPRVRAAFPGAAEVVHTLDRAGYGLFLASAGDAPTLSGYLEGMGIRDCINRPYGVDLVGVSKTDSEFYRAIFADAGVDPGEALVVDDRAEAATWASQAGAGLVLLVGKDISSLANLPRRLHIVDRIG